MAEIVRGLTNANILTPEEGRQLASDVFNREFKKINAPWVKQPVSLTLAGLQPAPEPESTLAGPDVPARENKGDLSTADLTAGGRLVPGQGMPGRRRRQKPFDLVREAERLIAVRDALREAEGSATERDFKAAKTAALETEVVRVPAAELASWFEPEPQSEGAGQRPSTRREP
jgi:hypothetical protein